MTRRYDYLVIGSGISGLNFALEAAASGTVAIVTKKELMESNSNYAQGGIAAVMDIHDSFESHIEDTIAAGCGINNREAVEIMVREAPDAIHKLIDLGVGFVREQENLELTQEGGHSSRRIVHAHDATGKEIERALLHHVRNHPNITTFESHIGVDLILEEDTCVGTLVFDSEKEKIETFAASTTIIASGGAGQVYARNSNPKVTTGDGIAMASRAGAEIHDMEFIQFHPTALHIEGKPAFLISETVRGEGGILRNKNDEAFMEKYHEQGDMAPRDVVSRAIWEELKTGPVTLDISHKESGFIKKRFPYIFETLWWHGIKMDEQSIPVAPAAHYTCGGIHTNLDAETSIPGLFAFGEVAHTGVHGANRLASNSLLECLVFSARAAKKIQNHPPATLRKRSTAMRAGDNTLKVGSSAETKTMRKKITELMWNNVGIIREEKKMREALDVLKEMEENIQAMYTAGINREIIELRNIHAVATLITKAALERKESIGAHFRFN